MSDTEIIDLTPENIADYGVCGYKDVRKHAMNAREIPVCPEKQILTEAVPVLAAEGYCVR